MWDISLDGLRIPDGKAGFVVREFGDAGPEVFPRGAQSAEDPEQLVDFTVSGEQGPFVQLKQKMRSKE